MKLKIKVKAFTNDCVPTILKKGDWVDLRAAENITIKGPSIDANGNLKLNWTKIKLGVAMELPKGFEAVVASRSSSFDSFGIILTNGIGVIDYVYKGNDDEWSYQGLALRNCKIKQGERICQFRIQLSQKATIWQKIKWLLSSGIEFELVDKLNSDNRGGYGTTGK